MGDTSTPAARGAATALLALATLLGVHLALTLWWALALQTVWNQLVAPALNVPAVSFAAALGASLLLYAGRAFWRGISKQREHTDGETFAYLAEPALVIATAYLGGLLFT